MAATFGAATQASFTAIVFVFELTRDYDVILPLMLATVLADLVYAAVNDDSLMTEKLRRRGLHVARHYGADPFAHTRVADIMTAAVDTLPAAVTVGAARQRFAAGPHGAYPLVEGGRLAGIVTRGDLLRLDGLDGLDAPSGAGPDAGVGDGEPLLDLVSRQVVTVGPAASAQDALLAMVEEGIEHVPVVDGGDGRLVGTVTRTDLLEVRGRQLALEQPQPGFGRPLASSRR